jgi:ferredoxin
MTKVLSPQGRRRFIKHLSLLGLAGVFGMGASEILSPTESEIVDEYAENEIKHRRKTIWNSREDAEAGDPANQVEDVGTGGTPYINRAACAHHTDLDAEEDGDGNKIWGDLSKDNSYCKGPCVDVCPVDAIKFRKSTVDQNRELPGFTKKSASNDLERDWGDPRDVSGCISCQKCFKICGYDAIQWVNTE